MSRRRPTDAENPSVEDDLPNESAADLANGKKRTPAERAGRFFRTRPVSSLLMILAICGMAMITFGIGRTVGKAVSGIFSSSQHSSLDSAQRPASAGIPMHLQNGTNNGGEHGDADNDVEHLAADERGTLVDGADASEAQRVAAEKEIEAKAREGHGGRHAGNCYRKFEPGKLGSPKMLCVTDEFYFDISIAAHPIGRMKIGVFGDVVPKSAANFRALVTCTGVFADESLCYRGDSFHRVVTNFVAQGGSKATGRSIYGPTFREEQSKDHHSFLEHAEKGVVSWAEYPIGSQFFVLIRDEAKYLDGNHVVFGIVTDGLEILDKIHDAPRTGEQPLSRVTITDCGDAHKSV